MELVGENSLVEVLPPSARAALQPQLTRVTLVQRQILWKPNEAITEVYFPVSALISIMGHAGRGGDVAVAAVGRFGLAGLPAVLGDGRAPYSAVVQLPGDSDRMAATAFRDLVSQHPELRRHVLRFTQAFLAETAQAGVCNCHHHAERRLSRWLLTCQDRFGRPEIPLTHEFVSQLLGMRRATVTGEIGKLQVVGLIRATPGRVVILDRTGLERLTCECYGIVASEYHRLLGGDAR